MMTQDGAMLMQGDAGGVGESMDEQAYQQMVQEHAEDQHQPEEPMQSEQEAAGDSGGGGREEGDGGGETASDTLAGGEQDGQENLHQPAAGETSGAPGEQTYAESATPASTEDSENSIFDASLSQMVAAQGHAEPMANSSSQQFDTDEMRLADTGQLEAAAVDDTSSGEVQEAAQSSDGQLVAPEESMPHGVDTAATAEEVAGSEGPLEVMAMAATSLPEGSEAMAGEFHVQAPAVMYTTAEGTMVQQAYGRQAIYTTADGTVVSAPEGTLMANADGNLVTADGTVLTTEDGTPVSLHGSILSHSEAGKYY